MSAAMAMDQPIHPQLPSAQDTLSDFGHPVFLTIEDMLGNWARWSRARRRQGHCASIEHRFRTPNHFHPPAVSPAIDLHAAMDVEREMQQLPRQHQQAIIWHFVWLAPSRFICRKLLLQHSSWPWFLADAVAMIANRLRKQKKPRIYAATIRPQPSLRPLRLMARDVSAEEE